MESNHRSVKLSIMLGAIAGLALAASLAACNQPTPAPPVVGGTTGSEVTVPPLAPPGDTPTSRFSFDPRLATLIAHGPPVIVPGGGGRVGDPCQIPSTVCMAGGRDASGTERCVVYDVDMVEPRCQPGGAGCYDVGDTVACVDANGDHTCDVSEGGDPNYGCTDPGVTPSNGILCAPASGIVFGCASGLTCTVQADGSHRCARATTTTPECHCERNANGNNTGMYVCTNANVTTSTTFNPALCPPGGAQPLPPPPPTEQPTETVTQAATETTTEQAGCSPYDASCHPDLCGDNVCQTWENASWCGDCAPGGSTTGGGTTGGGTTGGTTGGGSTTGGAKCGNGILEPGEQCETDADCKGNPAGNSCFAGCFCGPG